MDDATTVFELVNADIDGELSESDSKRLAAIRAEQPEVESMYRDTAAIAGLVNALNSVDPPDHLKEQIMRSLPVEHAVASKASPGIGSGLIDFLRSFLQPQMALQLATVFAGGLIIGAVVMNSGLFSANVDPAQAVGTVGVNGSGIDGAVSATTDLIGKHFQGIAKMTRNGEVASLEVTGAASQIVTLEIRYPTESLGFVGVSGVAPNEGSTLSMVPGTITTSIDGQSEMTFVFDAQGTGAANLEITLIEVGEEHVVRENLSI